MSIRVTCAKCGKSYALGEHLAGKKGKCHGCGTVFVIPSAPPADSEPDLSALENAARATPRPAQRPAPESDWLADGLPVRTAPTRPVRTSTLAPREPLPAPEESFTLGLCVFFILLWGIEFLLTILTSPEPLPAEALPAVIGGIIGVIFFLCVIAFGLCGTLVLLGAYVTSLWRRYKLPRGAYVKSCGVASTGFIVLNFAMLIARFVYGKGNPQPFGFWLAALIVASLCAFWVLTTSFGYQLLEAAVAYFTAIAMPVAMLYLLVLVVGVPRLLLNSSMPFQASSGPSHARPEPNADTNITPNRPAPPQPTYTPPPPTPVVVTPPRRQIPADDVIKEITAPAKPGPAFDPARDRLDSLGPEISFKEYRLRPEQSLKLDLKFGDAGETGLRWRDALGGEFTLLRSKRGEPKQLRPWIPPADADVKGDLPPGLLTIKLTGAEAQPGTIGGIPFTRISSGDRFGPASSKVIHYVAAVGDEWIEMRIHGVASSVTFEYLEAMARTLRPAKPGEPPADPFRPELLVEMLQTDENTALPLLRRQGARAEQAALDRLAKTDNPFERRKLIKLLAEIGTKKSVSALKEIHRSDKHFDAAETLAALRKLAPEEFDAVGEAIMALEARKWPADRDAVQVLARSKPDDRREKVAPLLEAMLADHDKWASSREAAAALAVWSTKDTVPHIVAVLDNEDCDKTVRVALMDFLGQSKDPRGIKILVRWMRLEPAAVKAALVRFGPAAEDEVVRTLRETDAAVKRTVVEILGEIGTEKCIPNLSALAANKKDFFLSNDARAALTKVRARTTRDK